MTMTTRAIPRTMIHTMYLWKPPRPRGSLIRTVATKSARWFASAVEETVKGICSTAPRRTPAGDWTRNWMVDSESEASLTRAWSTATLLVAFERTALHPEGRTAVKRNSSSKSPMFETLNENTASAPGSIVRSETTGMSATARLMFFVVSMMSSTHHPPVFGMMFDVTLNRTWSVDVPGRRYDVRFTLAACQPRFFP